MNAAFTVLMVLAGFTGAFATAQARTDIACTMQYDPVCGARQVQCVTTPCYPVYETFGNACVLAAEEATFIHAGECTAAETGPVIPSGQYMPPAHCSAWFDGCNNCSRDANGNAMCTLRACIGEPSPGYCTRYDDPPAPEPVEPKPTPVPVATSSGEVSVSVVPEQPGISGFFISLWERIVSFFSWF